MKRIMLALMALALMPSLTAQQLAAFYDYLNQFWVFDGGTFQKLEYLEIQDYQIGGYLVAYIDNGSNLKVYRNGKTEKLIQGEPIVYKATDYLLGYSIYEQLNVYDNGKVRVLSTEADGFVIQDSLIGWHNRIRQTIQVYYNGEVYTIEDGLIYSPIDSYKTGDNTIAYIQNSTREFKVFYRGEVYVLDRFVENMVFEAGRDIVAYMDIPDQAFKVFFRGEEYVLESFQPKSFQVGDDLLVYTDNLGHLKYFDGGEVITLSPFEPQFYDVTDRVVVFEEQGFFKTFCNGQVYIVERFVPSVYKIGWNTIAYLDQSQFLRAFQNCEHIDVSYEIVRELMLHRDLIIFVEGINEIKIFFMGQVFQN